MMLRAVTIVVLFASFAGAQTPPAPQTPPPVYTGSFGGGLAVTNGKNKPQRAGIKKNDTAFVTTFVVKF